MTQDSYFTIATQDNVARLTIQRSRFLGFAFRIKNTEDAEEILNRFRKRFCDATHLCYAYSIGIKGNTYRIDDNGEPTGTAGWPILRKIRSSQINDVLVIVVRYFGGVKLGTRGLIKAYGETAEMVLKGAGRKEVILSEELYIAYKPNLTGIVMSKLNLVGASIQQHGFESSNATLRVKVRKGKSDCLCEQLNQIFGVSVKKILPLQLQQNSE